MSNNALSPIHLLIIFLHNNVLLLASLSLLFMIDHMCLVHEYVYYKLVDCASVTRSKTDCDWTIIYFKNGNSREQKKFCAIIFLSNIALHSGVE